MSDKDQPLFLPWVGPDYEKEHPRMLLLGESHYFGKNEPCRRGFTQWVILDVQRFKSVKWGATRMFSRMFSVVTGLSVKEASMDDWISFWDQVAFYNYLQTHQLKAPRDPVPPELWLSSKSAFLNVIRNLRPDIVLAFGYNLYGKIWDMPESMHVSDDCLDLTVPELQIPVRVIKFMHPSSPRFNLKENREKLKIH